MNLPTLIVVAALIPSLVLAQDDRRPAPTSTSQMVLVNALLGGLAAGVSNAAGGRSFLTAFVKGSGGGVVVFAGKRIIAERGSLAAWTGRQVAAVGSSQIRNAGAGRPMFEQIILPVGPARVYLDTKDSIRSRLKLDLTVVIGGVMMAARPETSFDAAASLSNGALVFRNPWPDDNSAGAMRLGVIRISDFVRLTGQQDIERSSVLAHELIHVAQYDFVNIAMSEPVESWALKRSRTGRLIHRYVDFSSASYAWTALNPMIDPGSRPWEREAISLAPGY